jgi:hypothetical protein
MGRFFCAYSRPIGEKCSCDRFFHSVQMNVENMDGQSLYIGDTDPSLSGSLRAAANIEM